jgi:hypothetical protein
MHVCRLRIEKCYDLAAAKCFDFKRVLGSFDIDKAILEKISNSEKYIKLRELLEISKDPKYDGRLTRAWLAENNIRETETYDVNINRQQNKRQQESSFFKKYRFAAGVAIAQECRMGFPYWGQPVVLHLGSGSIRDVLRIMSGIWQTADLPVEKFVASDPICHDAQEKGIKSAAKKFFDSLDNRPICEKGPAMMEICRRLGALFKILQSKKYMRIAPETASLRVVATEIDADMKKILGTIMTSGAIIREEDDITDSKYYTIGLHPIMAPLFGICFRQPFYYPQSVTGDQLKSILVGQNKTYKRIVKEILNRRLGVNSRREMKKLKEKDKNIKITTKRVSSVVNDDKQPLLFTE